ncbi:RNA 2',3'-cyclic phosphodiesterase [Paenibacillus sp. M1]|uniref:RNA 2',3'-cyclic phosphodiesterase n=1 Tax=Paenibacillus haidiansis TaxID=1574488 RepID=A0ABU7VV56_9BACL
MENIVESWRIFIAIPLPKAIKETLSAWSEGQKSAWEFAKWVHPEDYHITVQFLGDTPANRIREIKQMLERTAAQSPAFSLEVAKCGTFGAPAAPRVLWAGVEGELKALRELQAKIATASTELGFTPEERPYNPHITLARKYRGHGRFDPDSLRLASADFGTWKADAIVIYRTHMNRKPMYEEVARVLLKA